MHFIRIIVLFLLVFASSSCNAGEQIRQNNARADLGLVREHTVSILMNQPYEASEVEGWVKALREDGGWGDINYEDKAPTQWEQKQHLSRMAAMAQAYHEPRSGYYQKAEVKKAIMAALDYWLAKDFICRNWWYNEIGTPRQLARTLILMMEDLSEAQRQKGLDILGRAKLGHTGQNLLYGAKNVIYRGILGNDPELVAKASEAVAKEIGVTPKEGIQPDMSFHQHGACLYNHGYGKEFVEYYSDMAAMLEGTRFAFADETTHLVMDYVLDGSRWMMYRGALEYGATGRAISRTWYNNTSGYIDPYVENLLKAEKTYRRAEMESFLKGIRGGKDWTLSGNKDFWRSGLMTHHRKDYYASVHTYSTRLNNTDGPANQEGLKNQYIADGCNLVMVGGKEYEGIFGVWDWQMIPGITVEYNQDFSGPVRRRGTTDFVGGVSDGHYGMTAFDFARDTLRAKKAWFFFDKEYVCLGTGITSSAKCSVVTAVNQCYLNGGVLRIENGWANSVSRGEQTMSTPGVVWHDRVAYIFPEKTNVMLRNDVQQGRWYDINHAASKNPVSHEVFRLWLDHGQSPTDASYAYIVLPAISTPETVDALKTLSVDILANTPELQAVRQGDLKLTQIAFYQPGRIDIPDGASIQSDQPCLVMIRRDNDKYHLAVADPTHKLDQLSLQLTGRLEGEFCRYDEERKITSISCPLPTAGEAGRSVTIIVKTVE